jgi:hypothetical protein
MFDRKAVLIWVNIFVSLPRSWQGYISILTKTDRKTVQTAVWVKMHRNLIKCLIERAVLIRVNIFVSLPRSWQGGISILAKTDCKTVWLLSKSILAPKSLAFVMKTHQ